MFIHVAYEPTISVTDITSKDTVLGEQTVAHMVRISISCMSDMFFSFRIRTIQQDANIE